MPCCARLLRGPLGLDALLAALRRFFWQRAGDWVAALAGGLCRAAAAARPLGALQLRALLDETLRVRDAPPNPAISQPAGLCQLVWQAGVWSLGLDGHSMPRTHARWARRSCAHSWTRRCGCACLNS